MLYGRAILLFLLFGTPMGFLQSPQLTMQNVSISTAVEILGTEIPADYSNRTFRRLAPDNKVFVQVEGTLHPQPTSATPVVIPIPAIKLSGSTESKDSWSVQPIGIVMENGCLGYSYLDLSAARFEIHATLGSPNSPIRKPSYAFIPGTAGKPATISFDELPASFCFAFPVPSNSLGQMLFEFGSQQVTVRK